MSTIPSSIPASQIGDPPWEIATLFPTQGHWDVHDYLSLDTNHLVEFAGGRVEVLPMPTQLHQMIVAYLYKVFDEFVTQRDLGKVLFAPLRVRLRHHIIREPDVVFMKTENAHRRGNKYWEGADLVVEVVSDDDPDRDLKIKRTEYAAAGIPEYWIVDPRDETVAVLTLPEGQAEYAEAGRYTRGQESASVLLEGLTVDVAEVFSQG